MNEIYFVDSNENIYDKNGVLIGRNGNGYSIDRTKSDLIRNEKIGKFINIRNIEDIEKFNKIINKKEIAEKKDDLTVGGLKRITKEENGLIKNYIVTDEGHIYDNNNAFLNFNEKRRILLMEWLNDPQKSSVISSMTPEKLDEALINALKVEYKEYSFDGPGKISEEKENERLAREQAERTDGQVNSELDIVKEGIESSHDYSAIEERGEGNYEVVIPQVTSNDLNSTNVVSGESINPNNEEDTVEDNLEATEGEFQQREETEEKYYYLDGDKNVYDEEGKMIEGVDPRYVIIDENNNLWYMDRKVGIYGGTLDDLAQNMQSNRNKGNVRILEKNNAGFGQIIIVSLVLLCLTLFIGVIIFSFLG